MHDDASLATELGPEHFDIGTASSQRAPLRFTFYWIRTDRWEGRDFEVAVS